MDSFIGEEFTTPKGGIITVVGVVPKVKRKSIIYLLSCSICMQDTELFPHPIESTKGDLKFGVIPCGCSSRPRWNKEQYRVRIERECVKRGDIKFISFIGDWKYRNTRIKLQCVLDGHTWDNAIMNFLVGNGCPECKRDKISMSMIKPDDFMAESFINTNMFIKGTTFTRNTQRINSSGYKSYWDMYCPICSNDEYTKGGLCSGVFTAASTCFKKGRHPCRCSTKFRWSKEQREYQINKICKEEGVVFIGWTGNYKGTTTPFRWVCASKTHTCTTPIGSFIRGSRCRFCRDELVGHNGYFPERVEDVDYLYFLDFSSKYLKVGRSFNIDSRLGQLATMANIHKTDIKILEVLTSNHQTVYDYEQKLLNSLKLRGLTIGKGSGQDGDFSSETADISALAYIKSELKDCSLTQIDYKLLIQGVTNGTKKTTHTKR
ncbi:hypothetical protein S14_60 [Shewanella sp. phage 1/4]|uniref:endonuclease n=1 Tax=Shewanella phage 1/4 TaxID=1458859 RepID=UPI0004F9337E|nr:endonuclease [Shewanella sp. phage 1/4]AHK11172.1 hypothetical protein S14_60 [Shewanella sp. phage 1/4]